MTTFPTHAPRPSFLSGPQTSEDHLIARYRLLENKDEANMVAVWLMREARRFDVRNPNRTTGLTGCEWGLLNWIRQQD
jgi:hypothetical protein